MNAHRYIPLKSPWVALLCTVCVTYPNVAWIPWNLAQLETGQEAGFWAFFVFRILYFFGLFYFQLRYNARRYNTQKNGGSFWKRLIRNFVFTALGCALFAGLSYVLPKVGIATGSVSNIMLFQFFVVCLLCTFIGHIAALYESRREKEQEIERLHIENLQSRCDALANQIHPHFFFNALNGVSALIRENDDENALEYVTKLSDIFRYILQSEKKGLVPLREEIEFVRAFMHVMQVRFAGKLSVVIEVPEQEQGRLLPVLSLLPLLENVTVHNRIDSEHTMQVCIRIKDENLEISNPVYPKLAPPDTNGIGLQNLRNRFDLMMHREIHVETDGEVFRVILPLQDPTEPCAY